MKEDTKIIIAKTLLLCEESDLTFEETADKIIKVVEAKQKEELLDRLPKEKEIYNPLEVGRSPTHAVGSNQNAGFNQALSQIKDIIKES